MKKIQRLVYRSPLAAAVALGLFAAPMAQAFEFEKGELKGSLDTTVSYGISIRAEDPADGLIAKATINPAIALAGTTVAVGLVGEDGGQALLGQAFLSRFDIQILQGEMRLTPR